MSSMNKLRVIIVDDEPLALDFLRSILSELSHVVIVAECRNGKEAIAAASELVPDLMFLDIQLPGINGFEVVKALQSDVMPMVVFVTAFDQYAIDAFDLHAVDYVLKPLDNDRVGRAVERAIDRLKINKKNDHKVPLIGAISDISERIVSDSSKHTSDDVPEGMKQKLLVRDSGVIKVIPFEDIVTAFDQYAIDAFDLHAVDYVLKPLDNDRVGRAVERAIDRLKINKKNDHKVPLIGAISDISERIVSDSSKHTSDDVPEGMKQKLLVRDSGVIKVIPFEDIDWVDAAGDYMCVHALGETHVIRSTLRELMGKLNDNRFARIHRSTIVNIERVVTITPLQKGGSLLHLSQGETLKVSRNYRESIRSLFQ